MKKSELYFLSVAELGTLKSAADKLGIAQPSLTSAIKKLETELGVELFVRHPRGVELSEYGKHYHQHVLKQKREHDHLIHHLSEMKARELGKLKLGVGEAWWELFVRDSLINLQNTSNPQSLHIEFGNNLSLMNALACGDIDMFIGHEIQGLNQQYSVRFHPMFQEFEALYVRDGHPLLNQVPDKFKSFTKSGQDDWIAAQSQPYPLLRVTSDHARHEAMIKSSNGQPKDNRVTFDIDSLNAAIDVLSSTDAIMPYTSKLKNWLGTKGIKMLVLERYKIGNVGIYTQDSILSEPIKECIESFKQSYRNTLNG
ncbi:LysR family transcriptional regulator [Vibrio profundi]|uniref:LysR family transcriptional regulator n=1 Tax=Vibrio profundi TaxID=1774960 RepID=UPI00373563E9